MIGCGIQRIMTQSNQRSLAVGASFEEQWTGGWGEIFPNNVAGEFRDQLLVDVSEGHPG